MSKKNQASLQFPHVLVFEASAGSGKTYALAKRYLQLLMYFSKHNFIPLRNVLAITFTNKATIEMKERILELLKKISLDFFDDKAQEKDLLDTLGVDRNFAKEKAIQIMEELIAHYTFFQVQTIDSFINALLTGCALNIDRSSRFKIKKDYSHYLSYCLDNAIEEASSSKKTFAFFQDFLEHYLFVENRNSWFPKKEMLSRIKSLFNFFNKYGFDFEAYNAEAKDVLKQKAVIFEAIKKLAQSLPEGLNANAKKSINRFLEEDHYFKLERIPFAFRDAEPPLNKNKSAVISFLKQWKHTHNLIHHLVELDAVVTYNPYIKLFHKMLELFQHISKQEDILFLEELNQKARLLFSDGVSIAEVYYRMATRFSHYLIDEFQDTSVLQWRNIEAMVEEGLSCGGSLFYVGDKKQAIYRFRGGEAELFDEIKQKFESRYQTIPYALRKNWRSQRIIVEFNNKVFSPTNLKEAFHRMKIHEHIGSSTDAITHIFKVFEGCEQEYKQQNSEGYVKVERIEANNKEERNGLVKAKLLPLIDELCNTQGFSYKDIAILCRDNEEVELITSWLLETQMPVESEKTLNIKENHLIKEIISFLHFLYSPIDELNFSSFILGEIFSAATGISHNEITGFIFNLNSKRDKETDFTLYRSFRNNYPKIWQTYFEEFFKSVGFVSTYELLVSVYECFAIMERFPQSQAFFMKFLELVKIKEEDYIDLGEFLEYLDDAPQEDLYVTVVETDSTHVLTIHKSKGLEFGVVILPFLYIEITPETGGKNTNSYIPDTKCGPLRLLRITQEHMKYSKNLAEIYQAAYLKAFIDELNNIYVALTRPKFELYIFIPRKIGQRTNSVCYLIPEGISELGKRQSYSKEAKEHRPLERLTPSKYEDWLKFVKDEFGDPRNLQNRENILFGNIAHAALSYIKNLSGQNKNIVIDLAIDNIRTIYPFVKDFTTVKEKVAQLIEKEKISPFFYISEGTVYIEKEVVSSSGSTKRIDRLIVKEKEVWIVDYKSSKEAREEHLQQLADYIGIIQEIYPKRVVDGFIVYLDDFSVEKVNI